MSSTSTEQAIVSAKANVMIYDDSIKKWNPSGSSPGLSKVHIYQNLMNQTYRVVGRKVQDQECVINCMLSKSIKYQANQTFLQWRDTKQVYGLHFQSKDETDMFAQALKSAVDNLMRIASSSSSSSNNSGNGMMNGGDNISLGKRSISSDYNNPLINDEYERQNYNLNGHNPNAIYTGINTQRSQQHNQVTSPPLSNSSSSSSSTISSNGLTINTLNNNNHNHNHNNNNNNNNNHLNGHHLNGLMNNGYHNNINSNHNYPSSQNNQIYNLQHQQNISSSSNSSTSSSTQQPLHQSSPIPPPPPPPAAPIFGNQNGFNHMNDNFSQKIYDVIPDNSNYTPNHQQNNINSNICNNNISSCNNNSAPPPPPLPTGLFNGTSNGNSNGSSAPPPPPPIASMQSLNLNSNANNSNQSSQSTNNTMSELTRSIVNRGQLKKVEESTRQTAPPQLDFLTEIRLKLEKKNLEQKNGGSEDSENLKPSNGLKKIIRNPIGSDSPKPIKKMSSTPNVINGISNSSNNHSTNMNGNHHGTNGIDNQSYDKLKQELILEFRKELQMIKSDIVNSILDGLRR